MENTETQTGLEKMDFKTADGIDANIEKLAQIFPEAVTETKDANGKLVRVANLEALKELLEGKVADPNEQECYEFIWPGKSDAIMEAAKSITKTLRPCPEESKNWDSTQNLYIEGDNLEALKLLQQSYLGKVKMIYIDPPYNTGKDFVYRDNFHKSSDEFEEETTVRDEDDNKLVQNTESNGRFHSDWCSMIYPRLKLARDLLSDDGVIFISIDDNEVHNLRKICDELFGEENFVATLCRITKKGGNKGELIKPKKDYILLYAKIKTYLSAKNFGVVTIDDTQKYLEEQSTGRKYKLGDIPYRSKLEVRPNQRYYMECPDGSFIIPPGDIFPDKIEDGEMVKPISQKDKCWTWGRDRYLVEKELGHLFFYESKDSPFVNENKQQAKWSVRKKFYEDELKNSDGEIISISAISDFIDNFPNSLASKELEELKIPFDYAKPTKLIAFLLNVLRSKYTLILDFFSGSATTAHACMQLNAEDGGNRKFIMVQLPEKTDEKSEAFKAGYKNICEIGKERIRRAGEKIKAEHATTAPNLDIGFRVLKVAESNMKDVYYSPAQTSQDLLDSLESNIKDDRTDLDLLFACLIDFGVELSLPLKSETIDGVSVHTVQSGEVPDIIACFAENIPESVVREIASRQPLRAVFCDSSFKDSPSKINVKEIFKYHSPNTTIKVL